jgi:hypothetical protein
MGAGGSPSSAYTTSLPATAWSAAMAAKGSTGDTGLPGVPGVAAPPLLMFTIGIPMMAIPKGLILMKLEPTIRVIDALSCSTTLLA